AFRSVGHIRSVEQDGIGIRRENQLYPYSAGRGAAGVSHKESDGTVQPPCELIGSQLPEVGAVETIERISVNGRQVKTKTSDSLTPSLEVRDRFRRWHLAELRLARDTRTERIIPIHFCELNNEFGSW